MLRLASRRHLFAMALGLYALAWPGAAARAHGPAPAALAVLAWDGAEAGVVRLNVGLARRASDGRFRFICPALWGDQLAAPAAPLADGEVVVAANSGLFVLSADGTLQAHPDPNARGAVIDLVRAGDALYALRVVAGQSQLLAIDAQHARVLWSDAKVFFSVAADDRQLLLLRSTELSVEWQWLSLSGAPQDAGQLALPAPVEYAFARVNRGLPYALVLEQGRPELGRLATASWASIAKGASSIAGPLAVGDVDLLAVDGQLARLGDAAPTPLAESPYVSCLEQIDDLAYACTRDGLARLSADGVGASLFVLSQLAPPDLSVFADEVQREKCDYQWQDLRFDLFALGIEVALDPVPEVDAGAGAAEDAGGVEQDAAVAPEAGADDSGAPRPASRSGGGCSARSAAASDLRGPFVTSVLVALAFVLARRSRR